MSERSIIEFKIKRKEAEIQSLEKKLDAARTYLQALKDIRRAVEQEDDGGKAAGPPLRKGSFVAQAREIILKLGTPVHIDALLNHLGKDGTRENKASLASSLAAYVRRGEIFTRPAPNTFGLVELRHVEVEDTPDEPPEDFGAIPSLPDTVDTDEEIPF